MSIRVVERVDDWDQRQFSGGYGELRDLADREFSGVVRAGGAELFVTVGAIVDVRRGTIEDFADASGTVYDAPHPSLPLLAVMQEADADVRAQYYTEETPISEVDRTLSDGGFSGFLELSENVLSGDYFMVYHGGNSMSVAYVGESERVLTDDEAFQTADDEVGIYKVRQVDVTPVEIPETGGGSAGGGSGAGAAASEASDDSADASDDADAADTSGSNAGDSGSETADDESPDRETASTGSAAGDEPDESAPSSASERTEEESTATGRGEETETAAIPEAEATPTDGRTSDSATESSTDHGTESRAEHASDSRSDSTTDERRGETPASGSARADRGSSGGRTADGDASTDAQSREPESHAESASAGQSGTGTAPNRRESTSQRREPDQPQPADQHQTSGTRGGERAERSGVQTSGGGTSEQRSTGSQAGDLERRAVPSLDPGQTKMPSRESRSSPGGPPNAGGASGPRGAPGSGGAARGEPAGGGPGAADGTPHGGESAPAAAENQAQAADGAAGEPRAEDEPTAAAEAELAELEGEVERLEAELADATGERDELETELDAVRQERDELATEVERLETELKRLEEQFGAATDADRRMTPVEAVEGTNLFVDYDSKGNATLAKAHGGSESRTDVAENLQLGIHTEFDDESVGVGGQAFDEFLRGTLYYRFARWVVGDLLFEIRDTGHSEALGDLYDAIPEIRRVEFNGVIDAEYVEDGQEKAGQEQFDVIFRHRMGDPLVVANLNDSRDPATGGMMDSLVTAAERVGQTEESLAAAFLVTSSFFESGALETVSEATRSGILSRDSRDSFVNLSRKSGYHLCLTAAREGNFHMEVPEL